MLNIGQEVMIVGDSRCPMGRLVHVTEIMPCDMGDKGIQPLYNVHPPVFIDGMPTLLQEHHLASLDAVPVELHDTMSLGSTFTM